MEWHNPTYAYLGAFVDELARAGVRHVIICPGSRSTPLALSFAQQPAIHPWVLLDERSAGFFALGLAKVTRTPVALVCTSGTAAANFFPAVAEASLSRVPLLVLTADRPPELRNVGAPQTMDQIQLYGSYVKWFVDMALPEASDTLLRYSRTVAGRAAALAAAAPAGPIHLNFPLREPLTPALTENQPLPPPKQRDPTLWQGRSDGLPYVQVDHAPRLLDPATVADLAVQLQRAERGLLIVGLQEDTELAEPLTRLASAVGFPILADPLSQLRHGPHDRSLIIDSYDAFIRDERWVRNVAPDLVVRFGAMPTSKPLMQYLSAHPACRQILVDGAGGWRDPMLAASQVIHADAGALIEALLTNMPRRAPDDGWAQRWRQAQRLTRATLDEAMEAHSELFEGRIFSELSTLLPADATLVVGNSMPIRDCDTFLAGGPHALRVLGNRGVNGIDGLMSTAFGIAAGSDEPVVLVLGDLSFYHDMNGLLAAKRHALNLTIVLVHNDGGGIFSFLPQANYPEHFELLFGTPHGLNFQPAVEMYGGVFERIEDWARFRTAVERGITSGGLHVIEVPTNRERNVALHRGLWPAVGARLRACFGDDPL